MNKLTTFSEKLRPFAERLWNSTSTIAGVFLVCYMLLIVANVIMRRVFGAPIFGIIELVCYGSLISCCFALAQTEWKDGNVIMALLIENVSQKTQCLISVINSLVCFAGFCYVSYQCVRQVFIKRLNGGGTIDLHIPLWIIAVFLAVGFILLSLCLLMKFILRVNDYMEIRRKPSQQMIAEDAAN
jgi:TRAP-type C4-dicarboxylate transport system permease small subunit